MDRHPRRVLTDSPQWPDRRTRATTAPATALPGIEAFLLQQLAPLPQRLDERERHQQPHQRRQQHQAAHSVYIRAYNAEGEHHQHHTRRSVMVDQQTGSEAPTLSEFENIALSKAPSSSRSGAARMQINYKSRAAHTSRVTTSVASSGGNSAKANSSTAPARTSRYLREVDRRNILRRIENGEKQASLAKEYQVSRAAISNLKQQRNKSNKSNNNRKDTDEQQQKRAHEGNDCSESGGHEDSGDQGGEDREVKEEEDDGDDDSDGVYRQLQQEIMQRRRHQTEFNRLDVYVKGEPANFGASTRESNQSAHRPHSLPEQEHHHHYHHQQQQGGYEQYPIKHELKRHTQSVRLERLYDSASESEIGSSSPYLSSSPAVPSRRRELSPQAAAPDEAMETRFERVTEVTTTSMEILITRLIDQRSDARTLQTSLSRVARLILEHALSEFPTRDVQISMPLVNTQSSAVPASSFSCYEGAETTKPSCAVTVSERSAALLLQAFQAIELHSGVGFVSPRSVGGGYDVQVPRSIRECNVLLLVELLDSQSSHHVAKAVQDCEPSLRGF
ncbi:reverse transcriptase [Globisporangium polare]